MADSVTIAGVATKIRPWAIPVIKPAITWVQDAKGFWHGSDRGAAQDVYETTILVQVSETLMDTLQGTFYSTSRELVNVTAINTDFFAPTVDQSGTVSSTIVDFGQRKHLQFAGASISLQDISMTVRAVSPTLLTPTPSLATLKIQEGWEGDASREIAKGFAYDRTPSYNDRASDAGRFVGRFSQTTVQLKAILAYIMVTARASSFAFPTLAGVPNPFSVSRGSLPVNVNIVDFSFSRANLNRWNLTIDFREAA